MTLSSSQLEDINKPQNNFIYLTLIDVFKLNMLTNKSTKIISIVNNNQNVISNSVTYLAYAFRYQLPDVGNTSRPSIDFSIPNINPSLLSELRAVNTGAVQANKLQFNFNLVSSENLDLSLLGEIKLFSEQVRFDRDNVTFNLSGEFLSDISYPFDNIVPAIYPAAF